MTTRPEPHPLVSVPGSPPGRMASGPWNNGRAVTVIMAVIWILVLGGSLAWNWHHIGEALTELAQTEANSAFKKDVAYRRWSSMHGGVYVPPTETTPPNPHLAHLPHRDVLTTDGRALTLVNPAYMTRQVHELGQKEYGLVGHITSLNPIRAENVPDAWEAEALESFAAGAEQAGTVQMVNGVPHYRFMRPLTAEPPCLNCHVDQGYQPGDPRSWPMSWLNPSARSAWSGN